MIETIKHAEYEWFLMLNNHHSPMLDTIMYWISHRFTWIPLYIFLIFILSKQKNPIQKIAIIILSVGLSDRITSGLMKPYFERLRPCHDPAISNLVHVVGNCGGNFGFVSSHAANCFALAIGFYLIFKTKNERFYQVLTFFLFLWAILVSYSRIYNGVHYPTDILGGAIIGTFISIFLFYFVNKFNQNLSNS